MSLPTPPTLTWSFLLPTHLPGPAFLRTLKAVHFALSERAKERGETFEILVIPNGENDTHPDRTRAWVHSDHLPSEILRDVRILNHGPTVGKGAALKTGVQAARGQWMATTDSDLPYDLEALGRAALKLAQGYDFITANRRLSTSHFVVPIGLLPLAYGRHRLGLWFNSLVRLLFPIRCTDTQAGFKVMTAEFARDAFARASSPGFFYDVELFLTCDGGDYFHAELPVVLTLQSEKSTVRLARDAVSAVQWLARIWWRQRRGLYGRNAGRGVGVLEVFSKYRGKLGVGTRVFLTLRWWLTPYKKMAQALPPKGKILDLGCGHGLFELALRSKGRQILGIDHDRARVGLAQQAWKDVPGVRIEPGSLLTPPNEKFDGIAMIDVLHYFDTSEQRQAIDAAFEHLAPGGILIAREVDPDHGVVSRFNRAYEKFATRVGFTQSENKTQLTFRGRAEWEALFAQSGFSVDAYRCSHPLFADILYVCQKPQVPHP